MDRIERLLRDAPTLQTMSKAAKEQGRLDTADRVADLIERQFDGGVG